MWTEPGRDWKRAWPTAALTALALTPMSPLRGQIEIGWNDLQVDDRDQSDTPPNSAVAFNSSANEYLVVWSDEASPGKIVSWSLSTP